MRLLVRIPFRWQHVKESFKVIVKSRNHHSRVHLFFFFGLIFVQQMCKSGEVDITVLYTAKSPLNWSESMYGYLLAVDYACLGIASAFALPFLVRFFELNDLTLCIVGITFKIARLAMMAYGRHTWLVFLSVIIGSPSALIITGAKSMISKTVADDEMGKTFSLLSCGETIANLVGSLLFTGLYSSTVRFAPEMTFLIDAGLMVLVLVAVLVLVWDIRRLSLDSTLHQQLVHSPRRSHQELVNGGFVQLTNNSSSSYGTLDQLPSAQCGLQEGEVNDAVDCKELGQISIDERIEENYFPLDDTLAKTK